ncbi:methyltransferase domain-containing protein [Candidatus Woesearchaeota archaeon]|nr:methyltransferase domain-containing protein [Candidatus Woesearchaeota archaeon]MCF7901271.1 methyltransferase domain-containing protein [Candidatus Woesearchaeota archaeon]MCF8013562.1 methyltransferase domain-containing protein [Candidatus Woesearchaeota archaeon]
MVKKMLFRLPRTVKDENFDRIIVMNKLERYFVDDSKDFHGKNLVVSKDILSKNGVHDVDKDKLIVFDADFNDNYRRIKRNAQIITYKDIGSIVAYAGLNRNSKVIEAGSGSGGFSCFVAGLVKEIDSYDIKEDHQETAKKNAELLDINNVNFVIKDVYDASLFEESDYDLFLLDVPEPSKGVDTASKVLRVGGFLVVYAPHIFQVQEVVKSLPENLVVEHTIENMERLWNVSSKTLRPATKDFGHTAFLCFIRKIF